MDILGISFQSGNDNPALTEDGRCLTYAELDRRADEAARRLWSLGARPGSRVALLLGPSTAQVVAWHALMRLGAVAAPLDPRGTTAETDQRLRDLRPAVVVRDAGEIDAAPESAEAELRAGNDAAEIACVVHTSGTSGRPRPVELTHGNLRASALGSAARIGISPADRWLCCMPLHHVGGLMIPFRCAAFGASVAIEPFDPDRVGRALAEEPVTLASLVPTMLSRLLDSGARPGKLRWILLGGGPAPRALIERALEAGFPVAPTYGMTETASQIAAIAPWEVGAHPGSVGAPFFHTEVRIGEGRRIEIKGPSIAAADTGPDGWLRTGDLGEIDPEGHLHVLGRADDVIVTGGENVSPEEVEAVLLSHPAVSDAAVTGRPDPEWHTAVVAYVVANGESPTADELRSHCRAQLAGHKVPKAFEIVAELPRNAQGKLLRRELAGRSAG
jgi:O-succinylbenzoic acid--CoA ligase